MHLRPRLHTSPPPHTLLPSLVSTRREIRASEPPLGVPQRSTVICWAGTDGMHAPESQNPCCGNPSRACPNPSDSNCRMLPPRLSLQSHVLDLSVENVRYTSDRRPAMHQFVKNCEAIIALTHHTLCLFASSIAERQI